MAIKGQEEGRRLEQFADKFGRLYEANVEITTGDPCEVLRPVGWAAPEGPDWFRGLLTPPCDDHEIVKMVPRLQRARKGYQVEIDFTRWLQKWDDADEAFQKKIADYAQGMTKGVASAMIAWIENPPPELRKLVGNGPRRIPRAFIQAAGAGNRWANGLSEEIPARAQLVLEALRPMVMRRRNEIAIDFDPLAEEGDEEDALPVVGQFLDPLDVDPALESLLDLEEQHDPKATGGTRVTPPKRRRVANANSDV